MAIFAFYTINTINSISSRVEKKARSLRRSRSCPAAVGWSTAAVGFRNPHDA